MVQFCPRLSLRSFLCKIRKKACASPAETLCIVFGVGTGALTPALAGRAICTERIFLLWGILSFEAHSGGGTQVGMSDVTNVTQYGCALRGRTAGNEDENRKSDSGFFGNHHSGIVSGTRPVCGAYKSFFLGNQNSMVLQKCAILCYTSYSGCHTIGNAAKKNRDIGLFPKT